MKRSVYIYLASLVLFNAASGQSGPGEFREPWKDPTRAFVLDAFEGNKLDCSALAEEPRVAGILHRSSKGLKADPQYLIRRRECKALGYKWGSFHVGTSGDPIEQAKFYLASAQPAEDEVMALDLEDVSMAQYMKLDAAERFIKYIKENTGRYPLLYVTGSVRDALLHDYGADSEFANTPLWYVRVRRDISEFFPASPLWNTYTLWQFASELNCCRKSGKKRICTLPPPASCPFRRSVPGTKIDIDVNVYYGTVQELKSKWPAIAR